MAVKTTTAIPDKTIAYNVYKDGNVLLGVADVELPKLKPMAEKLAGAGIAGEIESPALGQFESMSVKLKFRTKTDAFIGLLAPVIHQLDLRASVQTTDTASGKIVSAPEKIMLRGMPKDSGLGKWETAKPQDNEVELEITYLKVWISGEEALELDKMNFIYKVGDTDHLASVRADLGLEA